MRSIPPRGRWILLFVIYLEYVDESHRKLLDTVQTLEVVP